MSFQDRAQHQIAQIDKEVRFPGCLFWFLGAVILRGTRNGINVPINTRSDSPEAVIASADSCRSTALQVPRPGQFRAPDVRPQGLCLSGSCWHLLLSRVLQHRGRISRQHRWLHHPRILLPPGALHPYLG